MNSLEWLVSLSPLWSSVLVLCFMLQCLGHMFGNTGSRSHQTSTRKPTAVKDVPLKRNGRGRTQTKRPAHSISDAPASKQRGDKARRRAVREQMKQHKSFATSAPTTPPMSPLTPHTTNSTIFAKLLHAVQYPFNKSPQQPSSPPPTPHATPSPSATSTPSTQKTQVSSLAAKASALGNPFFRCVFSLISYPSRITLQALTTVAVALSSATHLPVSAMFRLSRWCSKSPFPVSATKSAEPYNLTADCSTTTSISPATSAPSSDTSNGPSAKSANSSEQQQPQQTQRAQLPKVPKRIPQLQRKPKSARRMHQVLDTPVAASFRLQLAQQLQLRMALFLQMTQLQHIANRCAVTQLFSSAQLWYLQRQLAVRDAKIAQLGREVGHYLATTVVAECMAVQQQQQLEQQLKGQLLQQASALAQAQAVIGRQSTAFAQQTSVMHEMQQRHAQQTSAMREMQHTNAHQASAIAQKDAQLAEYEAKIAAMAAKLEQHERLETKRHPVYSANDLADVKGGRVINPAVGDGGVNYVDGAETHLLGSHVYKWPRPAYTEEEACLNSEAKYLDVLRHPYIVSYHGRCIDPSQTDPDQQGKRGLILERMDTDLLKLIKKGQLLLRTIVKIGTHMAAALSFVHAQGFVHGDLKDNNIGVSNVGSDNLIAKLLDLGMVQPIDEVYEQEHCLPVLNRYAAPEFCGVRAAGGSEYVLTAKAEVWSLGCILSDMARIPEAWAGSSETQKIWYLAKLSGDYPVQWEQASKAHNLKYPKAFRKVVDLCLSRRPEDRPTMREVVELLQQVPLNGAV